MVNSEVDAVRILGNNNVSHAINLGAYLALMGTSWWIFVHDWQWEHLTVFSTMGFACRQITFDIPLNLRRGLKWDYVSPAQPPKAIMDRIEQAIFGRNGRLPVYIYAGAWILSLAELLWVYSK